MHVVGTPARSSPSRGGRPPAAPSGLPPRRDKPRYSTSSACCGGGHGSPAPPPEVREQAPIGIRSSVPGSPGQGAVWTSKPTSGKELHVGIRRFDGATLGLILSRLTTRAPRGSTSMSGPSGDRLSASILNQGPPAASDYKSGTDPQPRRDSRLPESPVQWRTACAPVRHTLAPDSVRDSAVYGRILLTASALGAINENQRQDGARGGSPNPSCGR